MLWFAFKLVSLNHWKQRKREDLIEYVVVICFQISIFEPLKTACISVFQCFPLLWFAFKLVSLNHWKQLSIGAWLHFPVVICFQISIFEPLKTAITTKYALAIALWFAFKLVSLNHWKQPQTAIRRHRIVVICFQISIFEPLKTASAWKRMPTESCDLLSN